MPNILHQADVDTAQNLLNTIGASAMYEYLAGQGYNYAQFANGVALENTLEGNAAILYMNASAVEQGVSPDVNQIKFDMAQAYLDTLGKR